ncbi:MAG TPA: ComEC/Rec2 family competence protein, partial [Clostridia bacterium]|nr:ComEC/Rec2 family competence protein [Clostridia bacterium]
MGTTNEKIDSAGGRYYMALIALSFLCGILAAVLLLPGRAVLLVSLVLSAGIVFINRRSGRGFKAALLLTVFLAGMLDYVLAVDSAGSLELAEGKNAVFECVILDKPVERGGGLQYTAVSRFVLYGGKRYNFREKVFLRIKGGPAFSFGDMVRVEGQCAEIEGIRNPGDFDYRLYYKSKGINRVLTADSAVLLKPDSGGSVRTVLYLSREKVEGTINGALPPEEAAILVGIITGNRADIAEETEEAYVKTGISHILSVSGLHVGFLMLLVTYALMPFKLEKGIKSAISLLTVVYYVLLIGAPLPAMRALIMLCVLTTGKWLGRSYDLLASVSFAAFAILVFKPMAVHDPGFMISFGAMYSIALLYPVSSSLLRRVPGTIRSSSALSLSVWLGLAPVLA